MRLASLIFIALVATEHLYILWIEMFAWETKGSKVFTSFPADLFAKTKTMAANQGLYNGFLATGLTWSLFITDQYWYKNVACFFLSCVIFAGVYATFTIHKSIFFKQALPAIIALILVWLS